MDPSRGGDSRYNLNYSMGGIGLSLADQTDIYGNPAGGLGTGRPPSGGLIQPMGRSSSGLMSHTGNGGGGGAGGNSGGGGGGAGQCQSMGGQQQQQQQQQQQSRGIKRSSSGCYDDHHRGSGGNMTSQTLQGLDSCNAGNGSGSGGQQQTGSGNVPDVVDDSYSSMQNKKSPPANGKKTKGRVKIKMEYIDNKLRRYTTFSKRKTGIMKKAYELSTLTGTQVMLLVASETGHVYTFATRKLQPMITSEAGKQLIQTCLNSPDPPTSGGGDQRMSATGFEETELSYNIADEDSKDDRSPTSSGNESDDSSDMDSPRPSSIPNIATANTNANLSNQNIIKISESPPPLIDHHQQQQQQQQHQQQSQQHNLKLSSLTHQISSGVGGSNNLIYPAQALNNISQEVLFGLVQSGHLQLHSEEDSGGSSSGGGGQQYITIPLSMTGGGGVNSSSTNSLIQQLENNSSKNDINCTIVSQASPSSSSPGGCNSSATAPVSKIRVKEFSRRQPLHQSSSTSSLASPALSNSALNGAVNTRRRDSSKSVKNDSSIRIKTEITD